MLIFVIYRFKHNFMSFSMKASQMCIRIFKELLTKYYCIYYWEPVKDLHLFLLISFYINSNM